MAWCWACMSGRWTPGGASTTWRTGRVARQIQVITDRISQYNTLLSNIHLEIQNLVTDHLSCKARCIGRLPPRDWWTFLLMFTLRTRVGSGSQGSSGVKLEVSRCVEEGCEGREGHPCCTWAQYHTWAQEWWQHYLYKGVHCRQPLATKQKMYWTATWRMRKDFTTFINNVLVPWSSWGSWMWYWGGADKIFTMK